MNCIALLQLCIVVFASKLSRSHFDSSSELSDFNFVMANEALLEGYMPREGSRSPKLGIRIPSRDAGSSATELEPHDENSVAHYPIAEQDGIWECSCGTWNPDGTPCTFMQPWKGRQSSAGSAISTTQTDADEERSLGSSMTPVETAVSLQQGHQQRLDDLLQYQADKPDAAQQRFFATGPNCKLRPYTSKA